VSETTRPTQASLAAAQLERVQEETQR